MTLGKKSKDAIALSSQIISVCGKPTLNQTQVVDVFRTAEVEFSSEIRKWIWRKDACGVDIENNFHGTAMSLKANAAIEKLNVSKASAPAFYEHCVEWRRYTLDVQQHCHGD